jgi:hypothetical protein
MEQGVTQSPAAERAVMVTQAEAEKFFVAELQKWATANGYEIPLPRDVAQVFFAEVEGNPEMDFQFKASSKWRAVEIWLLRHGLLD